MRIVWYILMICAIKQTADAALLADENNALREHLAHLGSQVATLSEQLSENDVACQQLTQALAEREEILEEKEEVIEALKLRAQESRQDETEAILAMEQALKESEDQNEELARQLEEAETVIGLLQTDMAVNREPSDTDKEINESFSVAMV
jgi:hypothetical protein